MKIIDLSQTIVNNMQVYPGDQPPVLEQTHSMDDIGYTNHRLTIGMHTGTHIDGSWHMVGSRRVISDVPLESFIGNACVIDARNVDMFTDVSLVREKARNCSVVLFYTGYGEFFGTKKYLSGYPLMDIAVAEAIVELGVKMVAFDSFSPDIAPYNIHKILLSKGVLIAENLTNLNLLINEPTFEVIALPLKIEADSAPARIVAIVR